MLDQRRPPVVVAASGQHPGGCDGAGDGYGVFRVLTHRLLTKHDLAGGCRFLGNNPVHGVGSGYVDDGHFGVVNHLPPVRATSFISEILNRGLNSCGDRIRHRHQPGVDVALGKIHLDVPVGAAVGLAHPSESDQPDPRDCSAHIIAAVLCDNAQSPARRPARSRTSGLIR